MEKNREIKNGNPNTESKQIRTNSKNPRGEVHETKPYLNKSQLKQSKFHREGKGEFLGEFQWRFHRQ